MLDDSVALAVALGVDPDAVARLGPFVLGHEPAPVPRPTKQRGTYRRSADTDALLDPYEPDARAGVRDAAIARRTGLTAGRVHHWRIRRGIRGRPGKLSTHLEVGFLVESTVDPAVIAAPHPTTARDGGWRLPEYLLRVPLHYDTFVGAVVALTQAKWSTADIARAIGICERDVVMALEVHGAR